LESPGSNTKHGGRASWKRCGTGASKANKNKKENSNGRRTAFKPHKRKKDRWEGGEITKGKKRPIHNLVFSGPPNSWEGVRVWETKKKDPTTIDRGGESTPWSNMTQGKEGNHNKRGKKVRV